MSTIAAVTHAPAVALARVPGELPVRPGVGLGKRQLWRRMSFWPAELMRVVALVYMLPIVIYAIGVPIALAVNAVLFCVGWSWKILW
jgi:hypothetical protein